MGKKKVEFWFEFASTYSYVSAMRIESVADDYDVDVVWKPFLLGPIFKTMGWETSPFNLYPTKGDYMWRDLERLSEDLGLPVVKPDPFPQNGLTAARLAYALSGREEMIGFVKSIFLAEFGEGWQISDKKVLNRILRACRVNPDEAFEQAASPEVKTGLKKQSQEAAKAGLFGAPTFITEDGELFWGNDRMEMAFTWTPKVKDAS